MNYDIIDAGNGKIVKAWKRGVPFDDNTIEQLKLTAQLPFVFRHVAAMPDAHLGSGSTIGTVLPTKGAVCPAAVGVDIGCGMQMIKTGYIREQFTDLKAVRQLIEQTVPHGRSNNGAVGDRGAWGTVPCEIQKIWNDKFAAEYAEILKAHPKARAWNTVEHLGTLGTGNHFLELATTEPDHSLDYVYLVLHSGSRGLGNKIGSYFTQVAQEENAKAGVILPHRELAYLREGTETYSQYLKAVKFAQRFAWANRNIMANLILRALHNYFGDAIGLADAGTPGVALDTDLVQSIHCHHNYINQEEHFGEQVLVTRKGAVKADIGDLGIIPGSMGARTYVVRGLGNPESFHTCSHGAGRRMSRTAAQAHFTVAEHALATAGVECDKTEGTLDETPGCYKDIEDVMRAQSDLVAPLFWVKQFLCVKGVGDKNERRKKVNKHND